MASDLSLPHSAADKSPAEILAEATLLRARREYKKAIALCEGLLERDGDNWEALELLGDLYHEQGELSAAMERYRAAFVLNPRRKKIEEKIAHLALRQAAQARLQERLATGPKRARRRDTRRAAVAALLSLVTPGLGQVYIGQIVKGLIFLALFVLFFFLLVFSLQSYLQSASLALSPNELGAASQEAGNVSEAFFRFPAILWEIGLVVLWLAAVADAAYQAARESEEEL